MRDSNSYYQLCVTAIYGEEGGETHDEALSYEDFYWIGLVPTVKYIGDGGYNEDLNARNMPTMANFLANLICALGAISTFGLCESTQYTTNNASFWLPLPSINMICTNNGNNITGGHIPCTNTPPYAMSTAGSSDNFRNIISYNSDGLASLGFEQVNPGAFCLSLYWFYPSDSTGGMVWRANRDHYVDENATMSYLTTGVLELRDSHGNLVWSTHTNGTGVQNLVFQTDIANLMLWDKDNDTVWQSFDHPTNKILQGQSMLPNGDPVYSSLDENSQTQGIGNYSLVMGAAGLILYVVLENKSNPLPYWVYGYYGSNYTSSIMSTCNLPIHAEFFTNLTGTQYAVVLRQSPSNVTNNSTYACGSSGAINVTSLPPKGLFKLDPEVVGGASVKKAVKVDFQGQLVLMLWNSPHGAVTINQPLFGDDEPCKLPKICYQYGVCNPMSTTQCSCPSSSNASESFTPRTPSDLSQGCSVPGEHVSCENGSTAKQYLVRLSAIDYFANDFMEPLQITMNNCEQTCLQNCKCYAAFYRINSAECFHTFQPVMTLINQSDSNYVAFIKLQKVSTKALNSSSARDRTRRWLVGILGGVVGVIALIVLLSLLWWGKSIRVRLTEEDIFLETLPGLPPRYHFKELEVATDKFTHKLGQGGFGVVYKGTLADGTEVAVKRLEGDSRGQGQKEFRAEVATIGNIHHFNLVRLCGFCVEGSYRMLVYEFMEYGSLDRLLFKKIPVKEGEDAISLDWLNRLNIAICTARGLAYLHEECREKILHLDIKPQNILLDKNFVAKVADFGLAKLTKRDQSLVLTQMRGTPGYLAPEWLLLGAVTEKADVYSYGMVLLELISGRRNIERALDIERWFFPAWASKMYTCGDVMDLVDKRLEYERPSKEEVKRVLRIAFWCIQEDGTIRPSMGSVVQMLEGHMEVHEPPINFDFLETTQRMVAKIMHSFSSPISLGSLKTPIREEGEPPNPPNTTTYEPPNCVIYEDMASMEVDS